MRPHGVTDRVEPRDVVDDGVRIKGIVVACKPSQRFQDARRTEGLGAAAPGAIAMYCASAPPREWPVKEISVLSLFRSKDFLSLSYNSNASMNCGGSCPFPIAQMAPQSPQSFNWVPAKAITTSLIASLW